MAPAVDVLARLARAIVHPRHPHPADLQPRRPGRPRRPRGARAPRRPRSAARSAGTSAWRRWPTSASPASSRCRRPAPSTGIAKRAAQGRRDVRAEDPRPARRRPRVRRQARRRRRRSTPRRPGGCSSPRPRAPSTRPPTSRRARAGARRRTIGEVAEPARRDRRSRARTAARSSSGSSRTATWSPPASRWSDCTPKASASMTATHQHRPTAPQHAAILGIGGYRPSRVVPNAEIVERDRLQRRVDPARAPASSSAAGPSRTRPCR